MGGICWGFVIGYTHTFTSHRPFFSLLQYRFPPTTTNNNKNIHYKQQTHEQTNQK